METAPNPRPAHRFPATGSPPPHSPRALAVSFVAATGASADTPVANATLRDAAGQTVGRVKFYDVAGHTTVKVHPNADAHVTPQQFHGFHLHAGSDPASGTSGCVADAAKPWNTWFASAGGHLKADGQTHGGHTGDLQSLLVNTDGSADPTFTTGRFAPDDLNGRAVVLHAGADNFAKVPVGATADQYSANSPTAVTKTQNTSNAGDRVACGVGRTGRRGD